MNIRATPSARPLPASGREIDTYTPMPATIRVRQPDFGRHLERLRRRAPRAGGDGIGMDRSELAEASGVSRKTIQRLEDGINDRPLESTLWELARALGVSFSQLVDAFRADAPEPGDAPGARRGAPGASGVSGAPGAHARSGIPADAGATASPGATAGPGAAPPQGPDAGSDDDVEFDARPTQSPGAGFEGAASRRRTRYPAVAAGIVAIVLVAALAYRATRTGPGSPTRTANRSRSQSETTVLDSLAVLTISSPVPCAYRHFVEGIHDLRLAATSEALRALRRSLECDSTLAVAWAMMADPFRLGRNTPTSRDAREYRARAQALRDRALEWERAYVDALTALAHDDPGRAERLVEDALGRHARNPVLWRLLGDIRQMCDARVHDDAAAAAAYEAAVRLAPDDCVSLCELALAHAHMGHLDDALDALRRARAQAPTGALPGCVRAEILAAAGLANEAMEACAEVLRRHADETRALRTAGAIHAQRGQWALADSAFARLARSRGADARAEGRLGRALVLLAQGRADSARIALHGAEAAARLEGAPEAVIARTRIALADALAALGRRDAAAALSIATIRTMLADPHGDPIDHAFHVLALCDASVAGEVLDEAERAHRATPAARAWVALAQGRADDALAALGRCDYAPCARCARAAALLRLGRLADAREALSRVIGDARFGMLVETLDATRARARLARACAALGDDECAHASLAAFAARWRNADAPLAAEVRRARTTR